jgi:hypothetical protein
MIGLADVEPRHGVHATLSAACSDALQPGVGAASRRNRVLTGQAHGNFRGPALNCFDVYESTGPPPGGSVPVVAQTGRDFEVDVARKS